jgi:site-specific DNA-methyltransferase (adenine-specific)
MKKSANKEPAKDQVQIIMLPVEALVPYAKNSRTHSKEQVAQIAGSIREFGFTNPVLVGADNDIIAGHGRVLAARKLDMEEVPCIRLGHLTDAQKRAYVIADNKLALNAGWDDELLKLELISLRDEEAFDIGLIGFSDEELAALLTVETIEGKTDPDEAPEPPKTPVTVPGDLWVLGKHRVLCGDSTNIDSLKRLCQDQLVDLWLTDPPYNVAYQGGTGLTIKNDDMADEDFRQFLRDCYVAADAVMKPGAVFYIWHADFEGYNFRGAAQDAGWKVRQCLIWEKHSLVMGWQDYHSKHEPCLYGWKEGAGHLWASDRKQITILKFDKPSKNGEHPTMKPVALFEYQMLNNTKGGDLVLDSFGGSGTTAIACEKNGRYARLMELDPKYVDVIVKRWQDFTGEKAVHEESGKTFDEMAGERIQE